MLQAGSYLSLLLTGLQHIAGHQLSGGFSIKISCFNLVSKDFFFITGVTRQLSLLQDFISNSEPVSLTFK